MPAEDRHRQNCRFALAPGGADVMRSVVARTRPASSPADGKDLTFEVVSIVGTELRLTRPSGQCPFEKARTSDKNLLEKMEQTLSSTNKLLAAFADCEELNNWRRGGAEEFKNTAQYQIPVGVVRQRFADGKKIINRACSRYKAWDTRSAGLSTARARQS